MGGFTTVAVMCGANSCVFGEASLVESRLQLSNQNTANAISPGLTPYLPKGNLLSCTHTKRSGTTRRLREGQRDASEAVLLDLLSRRRSHIMTMRNPIRVVILGAAIGFIPSALFAQTDPMSSQPQPG